MARHSADIAHIRMLRSRGMISPRAAKSAGWETGSAGQGERSATDAGWARDRDDYRYGSTSADGQSLRRGDGGRGDRGVVRPDHNNDDRFQGGSAAYGRRVSSGGSAGAEKGQTAQAINENRNSRRWAPGSQVNSANRNTKLRNGEYWLANYASRQQARSKQANEYYPSEDGTLKGDPGWRQD